MSIYYATLAPSWLRRTLINRYTFPVKERFYQINIGQASSIIQTNYRSR